MYYFAMQLISKLSKFVVFVVAVCTILIMLDSTYPVASRFYITNINDNIENSIESTADSIWNSMRNDFQLDHMIQSPRVQVEIKRLVADQEKLYSILKAAGPYIYFIYHQTKKKKLPAEIALIPVIESEFNPNDHSNKGATGLWQLMPQTARELGVSVKPNYDGRRNIIDSTNAALAYFKDLGNNFNDDWYLAIAAYNCGQGKVEAVSRRTGTRDFWDMKLPSETKHYVPKLLAVAEIVNHPKKYGVKLPKIVNQPYFTKIEVKKPVDLNKVAATAGINIKTLKTLNPDYNHGTPPAKIKKESKPTYAVLVPIDQAHVVSAQLSKDIKTDSQPVNKTAKEITPIVKIAAVKKATHVVSKKKTYRKHHYVAVNRNDTHNASLIKSLNPRSATYQRHLMI